MNKYLDSIYSLPYLAGFIFFVEIDFNTGVYKIDVKYDEGFPKIIVPGIGFVTVSNITKTVADLSSNYIFDGADSITEVGFEYGTDIENMTEVASAATTSPFTANLTGLTLDTEYIVVPYVKYGTDKVQKGLAKVFKTLAE